MNNIELSTIYLPILDEVYKEGAKTSVLDGDETTVRKGNNGEIKIAKLDMDALGDFDRKSGYTKGSTSLTWETVKYDKERSQDLRIDRLDNGETLAQPFAKLSSEFLKTKVIPETDAARIAKICGTKDITVKEENIETGAELITALRACTNKMDEDEVPMESRILFITPTLASLADDMDTTKSREVLKRFSQIIPVHMDMKRLRQLIHYQRIHRHSLVRLITQKKVRVITRLLVIQVEHRLKITR